MNWRELLTNERGAAAAEFSLVLPLLLLAIFGTIDVGRYAWVINMNEKATQAGTRWAVATDLIDSDLKTYSFAAQGGITQGTVVDQTAFPGVTCQSNGTAATCSCDGASCSFGLTADNTAFTNLVNRMKQFNPNINAQNVVVNYAWSGLGFSGDPNGPDVAPLTTVRLRNMNFSPLTLFIFGGSVPLPSASYALSMEDGQGTTSN